jgi:hypothetical protein
VTRFFFSFLLLGLSMTPARSATTALELSPLVVEGNRRTTEPRGSDPLGRSWVAAEVTPVGALVDEVLAMGPAFSLFRRDTALSAHPTTQGVSLRQLGPTAAARSLVLKDGVPQNDPFGGWVPWASYLPGALESLELLPAAEATSWGPLSAGGVVLLESRDPFRGGARWRSAVGSRDAHDLEAVSSGGGEAWALAVGARSLRSEGDWLVHPEDRGPIDRRGSLRVLAGEALLAWRPAADTSRLEAGLRVFSEERGNGSPEARNSMDGWEARLRASARGEAGDWETSLYAQRRDFQNRFTAFNADRDGETVVLDQFSIPSRALGGSVLWQPREPFGAWQWLAGGDGRILEGETNEDYAPGLANRRRAGGEQRFAGAFLLARRPVAPGQVLETVLRVDTWALRDGGLEEGVHATGRVLREDRYPDRTGLEPSGSLRWKQRWGGEWESRLSLARNFRVPTVNELYRPYRVGVDVFGANPRLTPERFTTLEFGARGPVAEGWTVASGLYLTRVENAVANLRLFPGPGPSEAGFVPAGGAFHRRENVARSLVRGWETRLEGRLSEYWRVRFDGLWQRAEFLEAAQQPGIEGRRFPFAPTLRWSAELSREGPEWGGALRWSGDSGQFDDALNERVLPAAHRWDLAVWRMIGAGWRAELHLRNLSDATVLTGRASDGERSIAPGRSLWFALRWER